MSGQAAAPAATARADQGSSLQARHLAKSYGSRKVVKDVSLSVKTVSYTHLTLPTIYSV